MQGPYEVKTGKKAAVFKPIMYRNQQVFQYVIGTNYFIKVYVAMVIVASDEKCGAFYNVELKSTYTCMHVFDCAGFGGRKLFKLQMCSSEGVQSNAGKFWECLAVFVSRGSSRR